MCLQFIEQIACQQSLQAPMTLLTGSSRPFCKINQGIQTAMEILTKLFDIDDLAIMRQIDSPGLE